MLITQYNHAKQLSVVDEILINEKKPTTQLRIAGFLKTVMKQ